MEGQAVGKIAGPNELALVIAGIGPGNAKAKAEAEDTVEGLRDP